jgi:hypothetical protein
MEKYIRDFNKMIHDNKLRLIAMKRTGKGHYKATVADDTGKQMTYVFASSPSDHRAAKNRQRDILRFFNN